MWHTHKQDAANNNRGGTKGSKRHRKLVGRSLILALGIAVGLTGCFVTFFTEWIVHAKLHFIAHIIEEHEGESGGFFPRPLTIIRKHGCLCDSGSPGGQELALAGKIGQGSVPRWNWGGGNRMLLNLTTCPPRVVPQQQQVTRASPWPHVLVRTLVPTPSGRLQALWDSVRVAVVHQQPSHGGGFRHGMVSAVVEWLGDTGDQVLVEWGQHSSGEIKEIENIILLKLYEVR